MLGHHSTLNDHDQVGGKQGSDKNAGECIDHSVRESKEPNILKQYAHKGWRGRGVKRQRGESLLCLMGEKAQKRTGNAN